MLAMYKERVISLLDLRWVCITCKCGTSITMDLSRKPRQDANFAPVMCQVCGELFDTSIRNLNDLNVAFRAMLELAKGSPDTVTFISRVSDDAKP